MFQVDISKALTLCKLFESLVFVDEVDLTQEVGRLHPLLATVFAFCYIWSIGGNVAENNWDIFDTFARQQFEETGEAKVRTMHVQYYNFGGFSGFSACVCTLAWAWMHRVSNGFPQELCLLPGSLAVMFYGHFCLG